MEELLISGFMFAACLFPRFALAAPPGGTEVGAAPASEQGQAGSGEGAEAPAPEDAPGESDPDAVVEIHPAGTTTQPAERVEPPAIATKTADPGDGRPTAPPNPDPLLEAKGKIGPKQMPASVAVYGIISTNAVFDSGTIGPTDDSPVFSSVGSGVGSGLPTDGVFLVTARQSRLGVRSSVQLTDKLDIQGLLEIDFFGLHENAGPGAVIQPGLRLRLAKLEFGSAKHRFIAGQDWSVVTPRLPTSLSHMVVAAHTQSGAVWGRLPQLTYLFKQPIASASKLGNARFQLALSVARNFSGDALGGGVVRFDLPDPGTSSRLPLAQAHIGFESDMFSIGAGGQVGRETYQVARLAGDGILKTIDDNVPTWMVTGDIQAKGKWVWVTGEGFYGVNINGMLSNQGVRHDQWTTDQVDPADPRLGQDRDVVSLPGYGGWAEFGALLGTPKVKLVVSGGADVGRRDLVAEGARWLNIGALAGLIYAPFDVFDMSVEYQRIQTYYQHDETTPLEQRLGFNNYVALTFRFKF
ncbi:hypothetical protein ACNOYE_15225 [Nannocystaceae bacterium ST9]